MRRVFSASARFSRTAAQRGVQLSGMSFPRNGIARAHDYFASLWHEVEAHEKLAE
jgi:hypothetical protein